MSIAHDSLSFELIAAIERGETILAPSRSASYRLKLSYAHHAISQGHQTWPTPNIVSFDLWVERLWRTHAHQTTAMRVLSDQQALLAWDRIVRNSKWSESLLNPQAAARASFRAWQRTVAWQIKSADLLAYVAATGSAETSALLAWQEEFLKLCADKKWLPTTLLPQQLLNLPINSDETIVSISAQTLRPIELSVLRYVEQSGAVWKKLALHNVPNTTVVIAAESAEHELALAAQWADQQLAEGKSAVGIVVPELESSATQIARAFNEVFAPDTRKLSGSSSLPVYAIATNQPLVNFPVVRAALDVLTLASGHAATTLAGAILRNPYLGESEQEAGLRALADARLRSQTREHYDLMNLERIAAAMNCDAFVPRLQAALTLLRDLPVHANPSVISETIVALWQAFGWPGDKALSSDEQQIVSRLHECLAEFGALDELLGSMNFKTAVREFEQLVTATRFAPRALATPITIVDAQAIDGLQFDALWVAGVEAARWPPQADPDPFIPVELQVRAGMPFANAANARELSAQRFAQLRGIAPSIVMSWPQRDGDIELSPSSWLQDLPVAENFSFAFPLYRDELFAARPSMQIHKEFGAPPLTTSRVKGGTRIFELQSLCPFRAQSQLRLKAEPLDQVAPSIDARDRGTLIHAALADIWRELRDSQGLQSRSGEQLEVLVRTSLARHANPLFEGATPYRVRMLQIEQELAAQRILALLSLDSERRPFRVVGRPETSERKLIGALEIELRLDRMDETFATTESDATRIVIDYKTGSNIEASSWYAARPSQPQLPLYAATHAEGLGAVAFATLSAKSVGYFGVAKENGLLPDVKEFDGRKVPPEYAGWNGLLRYWQEVIEGLANDYAHGVATVDPTPTACRYCHLATLCRVNELSNPELRAALDDEGVS